MGRLRHNVARRTTVHRKLLYKTYTLNLLELLQLLLHTSTNMHDNSPCSSQQAVLLPPSSIDYMNKGYVHMGREPEWFNFRVRHWIIVTSYMYVRMYTITISEFKHSLITWMNMWPCTMQECPFDFTTSFISTVKLICKCKLINGCTRCHMEVMWSKM